jgi:hypothetical protein
MKLRTKRVVINRPRVKQNERIFFFYIKKGVKQENK